MRDRKRVESLLADEAELARRADDIEAYFELAREGENTEPDLEREIPSLVEYAEKLESKTMLSGETDMLNAIVTVHPGAGGTESQDWAEMLMRMYIRWGERQNFKVEINEIQDGDEAGIKSATFTITGEFAFGLLSGETGVHRLVRISPFDSAKRRHYQFRQRLRLTRNRRHHRHRHQSRRPPHRHLPLRRQGWPARQHHRLRGPHHPSPDWPRHRLPERAFAAQEQGTRHEDDALQNSTSTSWTKRRPSRGRSKIRSSKSASVRRSGVTSCSPIAWRKTSAPG